MEESPLKRFEPADAIVCALEEALLSRTLGMYFLWSAAAGLIVIVLVIVWGAAKPMGESPLPLGVVSGPPQPYWSEDDRAEQRDRLMQRLEGVPEPVGVSVNEIVARYDRGLDVVSLE